MSSKCRLCTGGPVRRGVLRQQLHITRKDPLGIIRIDRLDLARTCRLDITRVCPLDITRIGRLDVTRISRLNVSRRQYSYLDITRRSPVTAASVSLLASENCSVYPRDRVGLSSL